MDDPSTEIPVIDLFAGPGGLSEGFSKYSAFTGSDVDFRVKLSIEKDPVARKTLRLRSFVRQFPEDGLPEAYYAYVRCTDTKEKEKLIEVLESFPNGSMQTVKRGRLSWEKWTLKSFTSGFMKH